MSEERIGISLTADGSALGGLLVKQQNGENIDGIHELPSGRWVAIGGGRVSVPVSGRDSALNVLRILQKKPLCDPRLN